VAGHSGQFTPRVPDGYLSIDGSVILVFSDFHWVTVNRAENVQCESKKIPPYGFLQFFPKRLGIFNQFLHTYYVIISTLDYKFLFIYLQL